MQVFMVNVSDVFLDNLRSCSPWLVPAVHRFISPFFLLSLDRIRAVSHGVGRKRGHFQSGELYLVLFLLGQTTLWITFSFIFSFFFPLLFFYLFFFHFQGRQPGAASVTDCTAWIIAFQERRAVLKIVTLESLKPKVKSSGKREADRKQKHKFLAPFQVTRIASANHAHSSRYGVHTYVRVNVTCLFLPLFSPASR